MEADSTMKGEREREREEEERKRERESWQRWSVGSRKSGSGKPEGAQG